MIGAKKSDKFSQLQTDILRLQGFKTSGNCAIDLGLGPIRNALPNGTFPVGAVHEFLSGKPEDGAVTAGFIAGILSSLIGSSGVAMWISSRRMLFPPALKSYGIEPDRLIFVDLPKERDVVWVLEEALKCGSLKAVIGEINELSFTESRRLQLAVEQSQVTGFILRRNTQKILTTACVSRWRISALPGETIDNLPGVGFPKWKVELLRIRNGQSGVWVMQWLNGRFVPVYTPAAVFRDFTRKAG